MLGELSEGQHTAKRRRAQEAAAGGADDGEDAEDAGPAEPADPAQAPIRVSLVFVTLHLNVKEGGIHLRSAPKKRSGCESSSPRSCTSGKPASPPNCGWEEAAFGHRFLSGKDGEWFEYGTVDDNSDFDPLDLMGRDAEDAYFDAEDPS